MMQLVVVTMSGGSGILCIGGIMTIQSISTAKLDLRLSQEAKQTLSAAARAAHCSVSQFVLASALERAAETLTERRRFELDAGQWERFMAALDAPPQVVPKLQRLFHESSPFESTAE
jgi:uncharacterized protein (DUF1778 family)